MSNPSGLIIPQQGIAPVAPPPQNPAQEIHGILRSLEAAQHQGEAALCALILRLQKGGFNIMTDCGVPPNKAVLTVSNDFIVSPLGNELNITTSRTIILGANFVPAMQIILESQTPPEEGQKPQG